MFLYRHAPACYKKSNKPENNERRAECPQINFLPFCGYSLPSSYKQVISCADNYKHRKRVISKGKRKSEHHKILHRPRHTAPRAGNIQKKLHRAFIKKTQKKQHCHTNCRAFQKMLYRNPTSPLPQKISRQRRCAPCRQINFINLRTAV